jgi:hypothetical protein
MKTYQILAPVALVISAVALSWRTCRDALSQSGTSLLMQVQRLMGVFTVGTLLLGCSKTSTESLVSVERQMYLTSRELMRRSLKNPTDARFYAPYSNIVIQNNDVIDKPDVDEVARVFHQDYWISTGLVDAVGGLNNKSREEWVAVVESNIHGTELIYFRVGTVENGQMPTMSKEAQRKQIEEKTRLIEANKLAKELAEIEYQKQRLAGQLKKELAEIEYRNQKLANQYRQEQERYQKEQERLQKIRDEKDRKQIEMEEKIRQFREKSAADLAKLTNTPPTASPIDDWDEAERKRLQKVLLSQGIYVDWKKMSVSQMMEKRLERIELRRNLKHLEKSNAATGF